MIHLVREVCPAKVTPRSGEPCTADAMRWGSSLGPGLG